MSNGVASTPCSCTFPQCFTTAFAKFGLDKGEYRRAGTAQRNTEQSVDSKLQDFFEPGNQFAR